MEEEGSKAGGSRRRREGGMTAPLPHLSITPQIKCPRCAPGRGMYQPTEEPLLHFSDKRRGALFTPLGPSRLELCPALAASTVGCSSDSVKGTKDGTRSVPKPRGD